MEKFSPYEKYEKKVLEPLEVAGMLTVNTLQGVGRTTLLFASGLAAMTNNNTLRRLGRFGLRHTLKDSA